MCRALVLEGIKILSVGDSQTDLDFTIRPNWNFSLVGSEHQDALIKKHTKAGSLQNELLSKIVSEMTIESKLKLSGLVSDLINKKRT